MLQMHVHLQLRLARASTILVLQPQCILWTSSFLKHHLCYTSSMRISTDMNVQPWHKDPRQRVHFAQRNGATPRFLNHHYPLLLLSRVIKEIFTINITTSQSFIVGTYIAGANSKESQSRGVTNVRSRDLLLRHFRSYRTCSTNTWSNSRFAQNNTIDVTLRTALVLIDPSTIKRDARHLELVVSCTCNWVSKMMMPASDTRIMRYDSGTNKTDNGSTN